MRVSGFVVCFQRKMVVRERLAELTLETVDAAEPIKCDSFALLETDLQGDVQEFFEAVYRSLKLAALPVDNAQEIQPVRANATVGG